MSRYILHVDQNCYFASVEMIAHPEYRNVPMAVVGDKEQRHGIILAKNQLASKAGVKTAEAIWQAERKCPGLVKAPAHYDKYVFYSGKLREMYEEYSDLVEPFGLDECWIDITDTLNGRTPIEIAEEIRQRVKDEFNLTCSIGLSFNKIFAKLGSDYKKPDALTVISEENFREIVWPLSCSDLLFVGKSTTERLIRANIRTIGDLAASDRSFLLKYLGKNGAQLWDYANGLDNSPVMPADYKRTVKSVGNSTTTAKDMTDMTQIKATFHALSSTVSSRLRKHNLMGNVIQITVRDKDLSVYEKQRVLYMPTNRESDIYNAAVELFKESYDWHTSVRSIGVRLTSLVGADEPVQMSFFENEKKDAGQKKLAETIDSIKERFGNQSIMSLAELSKPSSDDTPRASFGDDDNKFSH